MEDLKQIKDLTEKLCGVDITSETKTKEFFLSRSIYYKVAKQKTNHSIYTIAEFIGKNHATMLHAMRMFPKHMQENPSFEKIYRHIRSRKIDKQKRLKKDEEKIIDLEDQIWHLKNQLNDRCEITAPDSHAELIELINQVPEHHVQLMKMRLEPIVRMLPKTYDRNG